ncbi:hypothetical protein DFAR_3170011 [Desulfarculales bacterium]
MPHNAAPNLGSTSHRPNPRALGAVYVLALGLVGLLLLVGQCLNSRHLADLEGNSRTINLAARQRMLYLIVSRVVLEMNHHLDAP